MQQKKKRKYLNTEHCNQLYTTVKKRFYVRVNFNFNSCFHWIKIPRLEFTKMFKVLIKWFKNVFIHLLNTVPGELRILKIINIFFLNSDSNYTSTIIALLIIIQNIRLLSYINHTLRARACVYIHRLFY